MSETEYSYRAMCRFREIGTAEWQPWRIVSATRRGVTEYTTLSAARGVLTREKNDNKRYWRSNGMEYEYKIQRRPKGDWEDV